MIESLSCLWYWIFLALTRSLRFVFVSSPPLIFFDCLWIHFGGWIFRLCRFVNHLLGFVSCKMFGRSKRPLVLAFQNTIWSLPSVLSETVFLSFEICFLRSVWDNAYKRLFPKLSLILNGFPFVNYLELGGFLLSFRDFSFLVCCGLVLYFIYMIS